MWYVLTTTLQDDEETQKKGVIMLVDSTGIKSFWDLGFIKKMHKTREGIPKRVVGGHFCYGDASLRPFVAGVRLFLGKGDRARFRPHFGTHEDIKFELQTYGINPTDDHSIQENGSLSLAWHREWLHIRKAQEASSSTSDGILIPRRFDVLLGKGKSVRDHTGNLRANHLVEMNWPKYEKAGKYGKTDIAERVIAMIHESYGRFLKWEEDEGWVEVEHDVAREKISHFFRYMRTKCSAELKKQEQQQPTLKRCPSPVYSQTEGVEKATKQVREN
jgi:hypothetical protein